MKQREHESLDDLAAAGKPLNRSNRRVRRKLPKPAREATCVFAFFAIAAEPRISEKSPAFRPVSIRMDQSRCLMQ
jgi:hypothetical protein